MPRFFKKRGAFLVGLILSIFVAGSFWWGVKWATQPVWIKLECGRGRLNLLKGKAPAQYYLRQLFWYDMKAPSQEECCRRFPHDIEMFKVLSRQGEQKYQGKAGEVVLKISRDRFTLHKGQNLLIEGHVLTN